MELTVMRISCLLLSVLLLSGCGNPLGSNDSSKVGTDFQPGVPASPVADIPPTVPAPLVEDTGVKIAPGAIRAAGNSLALKGAITTNDRLLQGTSMSARVSLNKSSLR